MKVWLLGFFLASICLLTGCEEKLSDSVHVGQDYADIERPVGGDIKNPVQEIQPAVITLTDPQTLEVVKTIIPRQLAYDTDYELYKTEIEGLAKELARGTETSAGYDQLMVLDKIGEDGKIIKGTPRVILKESELVEKILAVSEQGGNVDLPLYVTESNYNAADISALNEITLASFTTYFNPADIGRSKNIELSAKALDNVIVGVGDYFSFNTMVGERTEKSGYQPALEIINQEYVMGIGGGICQTSSTLFNAVDQLGVHMTERHHHSLSVGYVPAGRDATVSYGTLDFKFQNSSGKVFLIRSFYEEGRLVVEVRGRK